MNKKAAFYWLFLFVVLGGLLFRVIQLDLRPMHHDEANQAVKFSGLLERGEYRYDRTEHHGPSLYYLSLPFAWIASGTSFSSLTEVTLRLVPVIFGVGIILLFLFMKQGLSLEAVVFSGLFTAVSPAMVFYSRFYIQETLLVFFLMGAVASGWQYIQKRTLAWAASTGFFCGMMFATKETCIVAFGALVSALFLTHFSLKKTYRSGGAKRMPQAHHLLVFLGTGILVSLLLYSSFFQNPKGILDSVLAFGNYFSRAGDAGFHSHPWHYYLKMLAFSQYGNGPIWTEALILVLALVGGYAAFRPLSNGEPGPFFLRFVTFYTLCAAAVYSIIPYKTPWNILPFYIGFILLAGHGTVFVFKASKKPLFRTAVILVIGSGLIHLGVQSYRANIPFCADSRNPYVYAQTSTGFMHLVKRISDLALVHPDKDQMLIKVITQPDEAWPLPWYLRSFKRVGYWQEAEEAGEVADIPLIISSVDKTIQLQPALEVNHTLEHYELRPGVLLVLYTERSLWDIFLKKQSEK
jgi:uncharacterized protein (TIGR03663 family)